jgi:hypothetical protein
LGRLALEDEHGALEALPADRLCELLRSHGVRLVFLNACQSAARDPHAVWNSLAAAVLKARIPAVVAMQAKIRDDLAAAFGGAFYRALVAGYELDYAVSAGRMAMRSAAGDDGVDWGVPTLYARGGAARLFQPVVDESARRQAENELAVAPGVQVNQNIGQVFGPVIGEFQGSLGDLNIFEGGDRPGATSGHLKTSGSSSEAALRSGPRPTCPACGSDTPSGARFCEICGAALPGEPRACRNCGGTLSPTARFCRACGHPVKPAEK